MSGIATKTASVTVLAAEGSISSAATTDLRVFHGGTRLRARLALRRKQVLAIPHANENWPGAPAPPPGNCPAAVQAPTERP